MGIVYRARQVAADRVVGQPLPHQASVGAVAFAQDGRLLLTASFDTGARLWEPSRARPNKVAPPLEPSINKLGGGVAISPDGRTVAFGSLRGAVQLVEAATGKSLGPVRQVSGPVGGFACSPDGKWILVGGLTNEARVYDVDPWEPVGPPLRHLGTVWGVAFSRDGRLLLTASSDMTARLWDVSTGKRIGPHLHHWDSSPQRQRGHDISSLALRA
jgi:WD40 repeat protein